MDALSISAIIAGVGGILIALYTHIKHPVNLKKLRNRYSKLLLISERDK